jgi:uncharacterized membrane protein HdeD (DUF308 family)
MLVLGILQMILGFIALGYSVALTDVMVFILGIFFIVGGVMQAFEAFSMRNGAGIALHLLFAVLYVIAGLYMVFEPTQAAITITLFLAIYFVVSGVFRLVTAASLHHPGWGAAALSGVINLLLGILLWSQWPMSGVIFIGLCVAFDLIFAGIAWISLGLAIRGRQTHAVA